MARQGPMEAQSRSRCCASRRFDCRLTQCSAAARDWPGAKMLTVQGTRQPRAWQPRRRRRLQRLVRPPAQRHSAERTQNTRTNARAKGDEGDPLLLPRGDQSQCTTSHGPEEPVHRAPAIARSSDSVTRYTAGATKLIGCVERASIHSSCEHRTRVPVGPSAFTGKIVTSQPQRASEASMRAASLSSAVPDKRMIQESHGTMSPYTEKSCKGRVRPWRRGARQFHLVARRR